jgi:hypothetical protein
MDLLTGFALATFVLITILFFLVRKRPVFYHLICAFLIGLFVHWTGRLLTGDRISEWLLLTVGLILYWFGLVIVRIMLTRSVSLRILSNYHHGQHTITASEGIAARLKDAKQFGLVLYRNERFRLTLFGRIIATIVASSYWILRIK